MSSMPKSHKPGAAGKPAASKGGKRKESQEQAQASRDLKRQARRKGLKAGSRQQAETKAAGQTGGKVARDPRLGSKKPVELVVAAKPTKAAVKPAAKPKTQDPRALLEQELIAIENDERLNRLVDRLDEGLPVSDADQAWLDERLARHQELLSELGIADEDEEGDEEVTADDLWSRFIDDEFDPIELDPDFKDKPKK